MSFKAQGAAGDVKSYDSLYNDVMELFDVRLEELVSVETSVTPRYSLPENNGIQSRASGDGKVASARAGEMKRRHSAPVFASEDEDEIDTAFDEISEFSVNSRRPAVDTAVNTTKNCMESSAVSISGNVVEFRSKLHDNKNTSKPPNAVDPHSACDVPSKEEDCSSGQSGRNRLDENSNMISEAGLLAMDTSCVGCDTCASDSTGIVEVQDECSSVLFTTDVERNENRDKPAGLSTWYVKHKTDGRFMKPLRHMSTMDRKSRPVPLPRSNTFRAKTASEMVSSAPDRNSIPVQYETCSSLQSKISQMVKHGDDFKSAYLLPREVNFSEIYVDHRTVKGWPGQQSGDHTTEDLSCEYVYDVVRESIWASDDDDDSKMRNREPEVLPGSGLQSFESDYDIVRESVWEEDSEGIYDGLIDCEAEDVPDGKEPDLDDADSKIANIQPSLPVDVSAEEIIRFALISLLFAIKYLSISIVVDACKNTANSNIVREKNVCNTAAYLYFLKKYRTQCTFLAQQGYSPFRKKP